MKPDITLIEAARELGIKPDILRMSFYRGKINCYKRGSMLFITRDDLEEYKTVMGQRSVKKTGLVQS